MKPMEIMSGRREIIATESFLTYDSKSPCDVKFFVNDEILKMRLRFKEAAGDYPPRMDFSEEGEEGEERIFTVNFTNFDDIAGRGNNRPIEIGVSKGRKIFMNCWISKLSKNVAYRLINITLYQEAV